MSVKEKKKRQVNEYLDNHRVVNKEKDWMDGLEKCIRGEAEKIGKKLLIDITEKMINNAIGFGKKIRTLGINRGYSRIGIAGACLYLTLRSEKIIVSQDTLSKILDISIHTLRARYKDIVNILEEEK